MKSFSKWLEEQEPSIPNIEDGPVGNEKKHDVTRTAIDALRNRDFSKRALEIPVPRKGSKGLGWLGMKMLSKDTFSKPAPAGTTPTISHGVPVSSE